MEIPYLTSWVIFLPAVGAMLTMLFRSVDAIRWTALLTTLATFVLSIGLYLGFDPAVSTAMAPQLADLSMSWFPESFDIKYYVGIDGLNVLLVMLTTLLGPIVVLSSWTYIQKSQKLGNVVAKPSERDV